MIPWDNSSSPFRSKLFVYFLGLLMVGLGYIAILPPFEGFDENAHFSRVREISSSFGSALGSESFIDQSLIDFNGPMPYSSGNPPYDQGNVYPKFFSIRDNVNSFLERYRHAPFDQKFVASSSPNWQVQHPPMYYLLMVPILSVSKDLSLVNQLNLLRVASLLISLLGLFLGFLAYQNIIKGRLERSNALLGFAVYPIVFPMFFLEFARLGNDSLCLLITGLIAYCLSLWLKGDNRNMTSVLLGCVLGAGLLTKAFFIPIAAGVGLFFLFQHLNSGLTKDRLLALTRSLCMVFIPTIMIGGGWYLFKFIAQGDLGLGGEATALATEGSVLTSFLHNFNLAGFLRGVLVPLVTFSWAGSWSLVRMPVIFQLPMLALAGWIFYKYCSYIFRRPLLEYEWVSLWMFLLLYLALVLHVLISMTLSGLGTSGGWYLHILSPWLAPAVGVALHAALQERRNKKIFFFLLSYSFFFQLAAIWSHMALFSGCAIKAYDKGFLFSQGFLCLGDISVMIERLQVLASPIAGMLAFFFGFSLLFITILRVMKLEPRG